MRMLIILAALGVFSTGCGGYAIVKTHQSGGYATGKPRFVDNQDVMFISNGNRDVSVCMWTDKKVVKDTDRKCYDLAQPVIGN